MTSIKSFKQIETYFVDKNIDKNKHNFIVNSIDCLFVNSNLNGIQLVF